MVANSDVVRLRQVRLALVSGYFEANVLHHLAVFGIADVLLIVVAHCYML
ncbi:hypothetical protein [Rhizobium wenxiniae]|nr:hypothetical protein [Rhizobium wenxiniae]